MNCPFCKGRGRRMDGLDPEVWPEGLTCDACSGTGDYETMKLVRACRLGEAKGHADAVARTAGEDIGPPLAFNTIEAAVIDDVRRQRYEEALAPGSPQRQALEADVARLLREREPLLRGLAAMADDLRVEREAIGG